MQFTSQLIVTGVKRSKGEFEGTNYDSTKVYAAVSLDSTKGDAVGSAGAEYAWGNSENYLKLSSLKFPFEATAVFEIVTNGRTQKTILLDVRPLSQPIPAKV